MLYFLVLDPDGELYVDLVVPAVVHEGDTFSPIVRVSQQVSATLSVFSSDGTAFPLLDFELHSELIEFDPSNFSHSTSTPVDVKRDNFVEPNETFFIQLEFLAPNSIKELVTITNPSEMITIIDNNSECACLSLCEICSMNFSKIVL